MILGFSHECKFRHCPSPSINTDKFQTICLRLQEERGKGEPTLVGLRKGQSQPPQINLYSVLEF